MTDNEGLRLLEPLREVSLDTPSGVDVEKAMRTGRNTTRRRAVTGVVALVGVAAFVGVSIPRGDVTPAAAPQEFSPLREVVEVGSAGGFRPSAYRTGRDKQEISLARADGGVGAGTITVFPPGPKPPRPALAKNGEPAASLSFEWSQGAWAWVVLQGPDTDMQARADRVRQGVTVAQGKPVKVPFTLAASVEDWMKLSSVLTFYDERPGLPSRVTLQFTRDGLAGEQVMSIAGTPGSYGAGTSTETLGAHQATVGATFIGIDDPASTMNVIAETDPTSISSAKDVIATVEFVPNAQDPAKWVADPFR